MHQVQITPQELLSAPNLVTGARFGWHDGAEALRMLIKVDQSLERRFDFGARSETVARRALAYVEAQKK